MNRGRSYRMVAARSRRCCRSFKPGRRTPVKWLSSWAPGPVRLAWQQTAPQSLAEDQELSGQGVPRLSRRAPWAMKATWLGRCASGQLQAAGISTVGLTSRPNLRPRHPLLVKNAEERDKLLEKYSPTLVNYHSQGLCRPFVERHRLHLFLLGEAPVPTSPRPGRPEAVLLGRLGQQGCLARRGFKNIVVLSSNDICRRSPPA